MEKIILRVLFVLGCAWAFTAFSCEAATAKDKPFTAADARAISYSVANKEISEAEEEIRQAAEAGAHVAVLGDADCNKISQLRERGFEVDELCSSVSCICAIYWMKK